MATNSNRSGFKGIPSAVIRKGVPSVNTIMKYLGRMLEHEYGDRARSHAKIIHEMMKTTPRSSLDVEGTMRAINSILRGHGVEQIAQDPYGYPSVGEHFDYVNMGDTYTPTVIYHRGKFKLGSWGDLVESLERRGKRFQ